MKKNIISKTISKWKSKNRKNIEQSVHSEIIDDRQRLLNDKTPFAVQEAYRSLYTNILYLPTDEQSKRIIVTSARSGEGKSLVSLNIAFALAQNLTDKKVLFVEADMRGPRASKLLNMDKKQIHGLSEYLAGIDAEPNLCSTDYPNLKILRSGAITSNSTNLFSSTRMADLNEICKKNFDYVIIDTPPVNVVSDALLISEYVSGYFLVVRSDYSDIYGVSEAIDTIKQFNGKIFGFVMTSYDAKKGKKYYYYDKYSNYDPYNNGEQD